MTGLLEESKIGPGRETGKDIECPAVWELGLYVTPV